MGNCSPESELQFCLGQQAGHLLRHPILPSGLGFCMQLVTHWLCLLLQLAFTDNTCCSLFWHISLDATADNVNMLNVAHSSVFLIVCVFIVFSKIIVIKSI